MLQLVPVQCSIKAPRAKAWVAEEAAQTSLLETAATAPREGRDPPTLGLLTTLQVPQVSVAAWATPAVRNRVVRTMTKTDDKRRIFKCFKVMFMRIFLLSFFESGGSV